MGPRRLCIARMVPRVAQPVCGLAQALRQRPPAAHRRRLLHLIAAVSTVSLGIAGNEDAAGGRGAGAGWERPSSRMRWEGREPGRGGDLGTRRCRLAHPHRAVGPQKSCALPCVRTRARSCARPKECGMALSQLFSRGVAPQLCAVRVF